MRKASRAFFWRIIRISHILFILSLPRLAGAQPAPDTAAAAFQEKCSVCHTVGGGKFGDAPDLNVVATWPRADLLAAIKRMEKNVGPLSDADIADLAALLQAPDVRQRLAAVQQQRQREMAASVAPGDPRVGQALFVGSSRLSNGGLPCSSCHTAAGFGGSFAVDLTGVFGRVGEAGLQSSIVGANFPVMQAAYRDHPITAQEATHLTEYFKSITFPGAPPAVPSTSGPPVGRIGAGLAALCAVPLLVFARRRRPAGTRARLVHAATRSRQS